jgi:Leucine-rich repeat (LRR) protein
LITPGLLFAGEASEVKTLQIGSKDAAILEKIGRYTNLEELDISCFETLNRIPEQIGELKKLKTLVSDNGNGCQMNPQLPDSIGQLVSLEKLVLYGAQDPRPIGKHPGPQPAQRHEFPAGLSQLKNLTYLDLGRNGLGEIPSFVADLPHLKEFRFSWNMKVKPLPAFMSRLKELETLRLEADGLEDLPDFLNSLPKLKSVALGNNCAITQSKEKRDDLKKRFPKIVFDFEDEYDCPPQ